MRLLFCLLTLMITFSLAVPAYAEVPQAAGRDAYRAMVLDIASRLLNEREKVLLRSLKVLPFFENSRLIPEISEHLRDQLNNALAGNDSFPVLSPRQVELKPEASEALADFGQAALLGKRLGASHVLVGTFRDAPEAQALHIQPALIDVKSDTLVLKFREYAVPYPDLPFQLKGYLSIDSDVDGVELSLDGKRLAQVAPAASLSVPVGRHTVEVKSGVWGRLSEVITVARNAESKVAFSFRNTLVPAQFLSEQSDVRVSIDEREIGRTPINTMLLTGAHRITFRKEGYNPFTTALEVKAGERIEYKSKLTPLPRTGSPLGVDLAYYTGRTLQEVPFENLGLAMSFGYLPLLDLRLAGYYVANQPIMQPASFHTAGGMRGGIAEVDALLSTYQFGWRWLTPYVGYGVRYAHLIPGSGTAMDVFSRHYLVGLRVMQAFSVEGRFVEQRGAMDPFPAAEWRAGIGIPITLKGW